MSQHYTTGEVANRMGVSKTTLINYINDFNLSIHKNPANNYREFSHEDVQTIDQLHASIMKVGRERALREWHGPQATGKGLHEHVDESIIDISQYQAELERMLTNQDQLMTLLNGIPAETRKAIETILIDTLPKAIAESMDEKAKELALIREQEKNELDEIREALKEMQSTMDKLASASLVEKQTKKSWAKRLFSRG